MSDQSNDAAETPEVEGQDQPTETEQFDPDRAKAKIAKANAEAKNLRERLKELEAKAAKYDEIETANKTELERATDEKERLMFELNDLKVAAMRERVARQFQLPDELASRVQGADEDEMTEDAERLAALITPKVQRFDDPAQGRSDRPGDSTAQQFAAAIEQQFTR